MRHDDDQLAYQEFLRGRWPRRTRWLATYAALATPVHVVIDWVFTRQSAPPPSLGIILALRLPWLAAPVLGLVAQHLAPRWHGLPALVVTIAIAWAWGNDAVFYVLDQAGAVPQAIVVPLVLVTTATFMPLTLRKRAGVIALMALGHLAFDLAWPQSRPLDLRLWADALILAFALGITVIFENFTSSQRRGLALRRELERTVVELEAARRQAEHASEEVARLAADVAHEVNNPLSAVKVNVSWLHGGGAERDEEVERAEVLADTLAAVERIAALVSRLKRQALKPRAPRR